MADEAEQALDLDEATQAQAAAEAAARRIQRTAKRRPTEDLEPETPRSDEPRTGDENYFDQFDKQPRTVGLYERARLNAMDGFYRGTVAGSTRLTALAQQIREPDKPDATPEEKKSRQRMRSQYTDIIADLARYDSLQPFGTSTEGAVAMLGSLGGTMASPENWIGAAPAWKGASFLGRAGYAALAQATMATAVDPVVQALDINAGVQNDYDYVKTIMAGSMGAIVGGGLHMAGEIIGPATLKLIRRVLATEDPQFRGAGGTTLEEDIAAAQREALEAPHSAAEAKPPPDPEQQAAEIAQREATEEAAKPPEAKPPEEKPPGEAEAKPPEAPPAVKPPEVDEYGIPIIERKPVEFEADKNLGDIVATNKWNTKLLADTIAEGGPAGKVLQDAEAAYAAEVKKINDAGFKTQEVNSFNARRNPEVLASNKQRSQIGGQAGRILNALKKSKGEITEGIQKDLDELRALVDRGPEEPLPTRPPLPPQTNAEAVRQRINEGPDMQVPPEPEPPPAPPARAEPVLSPDAQRALEVIRAERKGSTSFLQRRLKLGYAKILPIMKELEDAGIISAPDHAGRRKVLEGREPAEVAAEAPPPPEVIPEAEAPKERPPGYPKEAPTEIFSGAGRTEKGAAYAGPDVPIAGKGRYFSFDQETAREFGPNVTKATIGDEVQNPLVITDARQWKALTKDAGWEFPNPFNQPKQKVEQWTAKLKDLVQKKGHDGIVVWWDDKIEQDIGPKGEEIKLLRAVFDKPQIVSYNEPVKVVRPARQKKIDENKLSILPFLAFRGGLRPSPELAVIFGGKNPFIPGFGRLFRQDGMSLENALKAAVQGKFLPERPSAAVEAAETKTAHNKLLELIDEESRGRKQYGMGREPEAKPEGEAERMHQIEARAKQMLDDINFDPKTREGIEQRLTEIIHKEGETNAEAALERWLIEAADRSDAKARHESTGEIAGWDVDDAGATFESGEHFPVEEPGGVEGRGVPSVEATEAGPQLVLPGGERSAVQLAASREQTGHGMMKAAEPQKEAGPLFAPGETEQDLLFSRTPGAPARPAGGIRPPPPRDVKLRSLQQLARDLAEAIGIPLRTGRVESGAVGQFSARTGVARVEQIGDFVVVAHEMGHGLEAKVGQPLTALTRLHDVELSRLLTPAQRTNLDPATRIKEGFAEYMQSFMNNPAYAASQAPGFTVEFKNLMEMQHPELWKTLTDTAEAFRDFRDAPSENAIHAVIRSRSDEPKFWRKVIDTVRGEGFYPDIKNVLPNLYTGIFDEHAPMTRAVKALALAIREQTGKTVDLLAADNPAVLIRFFKRSMQTAIHDLMDGVRPFGGIIPEGPSPSDALMHATGSRTMWGRWQEGPTALFVDYITARAGLVAWDRFHAGEIPNAPVPFSRGDAVQAIAEIEKQMPTFREASDMLHQWNLRLLKKGYDAGIISPELYKQALLQPFYVPLMRDMSEKGIKKKLGGGAALEGPGLTDVIKRIRGSQRDIMNPLEAMMAHAFLMDRTIHHNEIIGALVRLSKRAGIEGGKFAEELPAHEAAKYTFDLQQAVEQLGKEHGIDPLHMQQIAQSITDIFGDDPVMGSFFRMERTGARGEPIVFWRDNGQLKAVRVMTKEEGYDLYNQLTQMPQAMTDWWVQTIGAFAAVKRGGITLNPTFMLSNYIRDQFATAILMRGYIPIYSGMTGVKEEFTQGQHAALYAYAGGVAGSGYTGAIERAAEADIQVLAARGNVIQRVRGISDLKEVVSISEAGTRNSIFKQVFQEKRRQGLSEYEAMWEAAHQAQDIMDFGRHGSKMRIIAQMLPFFNAHLQGIDKGRRVLFDPIINRMRHGDVFTQDSEAFSNAMMSWAKVAGVGGVLGAVYAAIMWDNEAYRDASPQLKGTHLVVPIGGKLVLAPKPFELATFFTLGEYAVARWAHDDPRALGQFVNAAWQALEPPSMMTDIPLLSTYSQLKLGKSYFTGQDIVPEELQRFRPEEQFKPGTSLFSKQMGKLIGVSPIKIDFAIGDVFGTWGRDAMTMSNAIDQEGAAHNWEDRALTRRFIKDPTRTSDVTTQFWNFMRRTTGTYNQDLATYQWYMDQGRDDKAREFVSKLPVNEKTFVTVNKAADENGKPAFDADEKRVHPLQRAYNAVTVLNGLRKEVDENIVRVGEDREPFPLNPAQRRDLLDAMRELGQTEMRNALVILQEDGYKGRPLMDVELPMEKIRRISQPMADEVASRYATANVFTTKSVAEAWPQYRDELVKNGSDADISGLAYDVKGEGYEFGADRLRKPAKRRIFIK